MEYGDVTIQDQAAVLPSNDIGFFTHDMTTATGTISVTGIGFKPSVVQLIVNLQSTKYVSWGMDNVAQQAYVARNGAATGYQGGGGDGYGQSYECFSSSGNQIYGDVQSLDTDGFTLANTKVASPTGSARFQYLAFK